MESNAVNYVLDFISLWGHVFPFWWLCERNVVWPQGVLHLRYVWKVYLKRSGLRRESQ